MLVMNLQGKKKNKHNRKREKERYLWLSLFMQKSSRNQPLQVLVSCGYRLVKNLIRTLEAKKP